MTTKTREERRAALGRLMGMLPDPPSPLPESPPPPPLPPLGPAPEAVAAMPVPPPAAAQPATPPPVPEVRPAPVLPPAFAARPAGRPPARLRTTQISLRLPDRWLDILHERAGEASRAERRTITPQALILEMIEASLPAEERRHG